MTDGAPKNEKSGLWSMLKRPSAKYSLLTLLVVGFFSGILFWGAFNTGMEATNNLDFCISCHEMRDNVYQEYKQTIHYSNRTGVRATCPDCHVPKDWTHKIIRKVQASKELYGKVMGTIDTKEKFEAKRLELARHEWKRMKDNDSRECRNCHSFDGMNGEMQKQRARKQHENAREDNMTCIDCHKGIAHHLPEDMTEDDL
ncbi:nitrate reductase, cytochrome c-type,periplasmic [Sterolibacterium denitrificans]|uniref:Cytochrome c-type protein n=1 Tax=Sterolibacterium denitrificans TaxID=157592 RepID=A0A7Z7HTY2_9PROT|nr:NapC/NirT family cytochrome c [Sterolibacterium denitrificans]SMB28512.1 nitrate reductase, cytochrome c-type,periplasmic [Sterolibacterium denitrificans]